MYQFGVVWWFYYFVFACLAGFQVVKQFSYGVDWNKIEIN